MRKCCCPSSLPSGGGPPGPQGPEGPPGPEGPAGPAGQPGFFTSESIDSTDSPFSATGTGVIIFTDSTAATVTILLPPAPAANTEFIVKDSGGNATDNNITVEGNGNTIDGQAIFVLGTDYQSAWFRWNGTEWSVL